MLSLSLQPKLVHEMLAFETVEIACGANHMIAITCKCKIKYSIASYDDFVPSLFILILPGLFL